MWFIIRHGETLHNYNKIKQGHYSSMLDLKGIDQVKSIAYRLISTNENFNDYKLLTSPIIRARHSMQIIREILQITDKKEVEDPLLASMNCGDFTNFSKKNIEIDYPEIFKRKTEDYWNYRFPNGETNAEIYQRLLQFYAKYKNEKNMLIVTHSSCIKFLKNILLGLPMEETNIVKTNQNYFFSWNGEKIERL